jgi:glycosyltransferase involved in cell wall biosynthesis
MRDFPSLRGIEQTPALSAQTEEIGYVEYGLAPGIYSLMKEQVKLGVNFNVIAAKREGIADYEALEGIEVHRVGKPYNVAALLKMRKLNGAVGIDIVHAHATSAFLYALLRPLMGKKPYVVHVHGTTAGVTEAFKASHYAMLGRSQKQKFRTWVSLRRQKAVWKRADVLIAVSENIADELERFYEIPREKIRVVHNGVDVNVFKPVNEEVKRNARKKVGLRGEPIILYVGHLSPRKGLQYLLEAVPRVVKEFPEALFVIVGGTPEFVEERDYRQIWIEQASKLGVSRNVFFAGEVRHKDTLDYYSSADVFVFPTLYEGLAKALLEAMACGLPIVTTIVGGNPDVILHEENGILIEPGKTNMLADMLVRLLLNKSYAKKLGKKARETVEKDFTWKTAAIKLMNIYKEVLSS